MDQEAKEMDRVAILNRGARPFHISVDGKPVILRPGESVRVDPSQAKELLDYKELVDASTIVKDLPLAAYKKRVADLEAKVKALEEALATKNEDDKKEPPEESQAEAPRAKKKK